MKAADGRTGRCCWLKKAGSSGGWGRGRRLWALLLSATAGFFGGRRLWRGELWSGLYGSWRGDQRKEGGGDFSGFGRCGNGGCCLWRGRLVWVCGGCQLKMIGNRGRSALWVQGRRSWRWLKSVEGRGTGDCGSLPTVVGKKPIPPKKSPLVCSWRWQEIGVPPWGGPWCRLEKREKKWGLSSWFSAEKRWIAEREGSKSLARGSGRFRVKKKKCLGFLFFLCCPLPSIFKIPYA